MTNGSVLLTHIPKLLRQGDTKTEYTSRYVGSLCADVHRTLHHGGIFGHPADAKRPNGQLHLLYEAAPMAFLVEQAGGLALTGKNRIMDIPPTNVHQRVPCICKYLQRVIVQSCNGTTFETHLLIFVSICSGKPRGRLGNATILSKEQ